VPRLFDLLNEIVLLSRFVKIFKEKVGVPQNYGKVIFEIVSDFAGELTDRFNAFGLPQFFVYCFQFTRALFYFLLKFALICFELCFDFFAFLYFILQLT